MTEYESAPGFMFYGGRQFTCPCGNSDFKTEIGKEPTRFWCVCGAIYDEQLVYAMGEERKEVMDSGV